jgi:PAS domain S-box-containing protein
MATTAPRPDDRYEQAPVACFSVGRDGTIHRANRAAARLLGVDKAELQGGWLAAFVDPHALPAFREFLARAFADASPGDAGSAYLTGEWRLRRAGQATAIDVLVAADRNGSLCELAVTDISALKDVQNRLRENKDDLNRAQALAHIGNWRLSVGSGTETWSDETYRIFGVPQGSLRANDTFFDCIHPDDRDHVRQKWMEALQGAPYDIDHRIVVDGAVKWVRERASLEFDAQGQLSGGFGVTEDITERKLLLEDIRRRDQCQRALLDNIPCLAWMKDEQCRFVAVNTPFANTFGYTSPDELVGQNDFAIAPPEMAETYRASDQEVMDRCVSTRVEEIIETGNGRRWFETYKSPVILDGRIIGTAGFAHDITERRQADAALQAAKAEAERANRAKSRFLAAASHDLRQPLAALVLYVDVLKGRIGHSEGPLLRNISSCVSSLNELLTDLLDLSKLDAGVVVPDIVDFPIADVLANLIAVHAPEAQLKGLRLRWRPSRFVAHTDPVLFQRLLGNLIANAIRYTEHGGVLVACRRRQGRYRIEVWDTGIGIPEDKSSEIFEEFRQLGHDERNRGSGLGLAIVARTARLLGLQIDVRSRLGRGSLFAVDVPAGKARKMPTRRTAKRRPLRIGLVDDNPDVLTAMSCSLEAMGHTVVAAASGDELLGMLGRKAPDVVVSDYRLPGGQTGFDVVAAARQAFGADLPALIVTGDTDPAVMRSMADRGIVVQHKPLQLEQLKTCLATLTTPRPNRATREIKP